MIAAIVQARTSSTRLPGKVLLPLCGEPMLARQLQRLERVAGVQLMVATSEESTDDAIARLAESRGVPCHRGSLRDVLTRVRDAAASVGAEHVVRLTGDCPLADPDVIDRVLRAHLDLGNDYTSNVLERSHPDGLDVEVVRFTSLDRAAREATLELEREHVTPFIYRRASEFQIGHVRNEEDRSALRWVVDTAEDYAFVCAVFEALLPGTPFFGMRDVLQLLSERPEIAALNAAHDGAARWPRALLADVLSSESRA